MQKTLGLILTLLLASSAQAYDLSHKAYLGITVGSTPPSCKARFKNTLHQNGIEFKQQVTNLGLTLGRSDGTIGAELNWLIINFNNYSAATNNLSVRFTDIIVVPNLLYNFYSDNTWTLKALIGFGIEGR